MTFNLIRLGKRDRKYNWKPPILLPKKTQKKSKINFPQFLRCMYVCMYVCLYMCALQVTPFDVWSYFFTFFYHDICQYSLRGKDNHLGDILKFGGVMSLLPF